MSEPESNVPLTNDHFPEGSVDAGIYATHVEGFEHSLVVLAMGETCWLVPADSGHHLRVEPAALNATRQQLAYFDRESIGWPPQPIIDEVPVLKRVPLSPLVWVLGVVVAFWAQGEHPGLTDAGLLDASQVFDRGEWWRAGSALWLHADVRHLVSNAASGLLVFSAVVTTFGLRASWWLIAGAAVGGNLAVVALHYGDDYRSLGASTAVFAGLGLLVGRAVRVVSRSGHPRHWRTMFMPLASGLAVLGLFGAGGVNIDVLAHATGFVAGLALGFVANRTTQKDQA
jgi:membrane associated rhomboid family serine protease